jgi:RNA ligase (TIGR02306 family)
MSTLTVKVVNIDDVLVHPNADKLELAIIKGFQAVVKKDQYRKGDKVVFIPPDTMLTKELATKYGVLSYLSIRNTVNPLGTELEAAKTKVVRLRGEPSMGLIIPCEDPSWEEGKDVAEILGLWKYEPPIAEVAVDQGHEHPLFHRYTEIENLRHYPDLFEGMEVVATEKIHGSCNSVGFVMDRLDSDSESLIAIRMAGSRRLRRKIPVKTDESVCSTEPEIYYDYPDFENLAIDEDAMAKNRFWYAWTLDSVRDLMLHLQSTNPVSVILFGEIYGNGIQKGFNYGFSSNFGFRAFDLCIDGRYVDYTVFEDLCNRFGVETAPVVYRGVYDLEALRKLTNGPSILPGATHIREGIVVRPVSEGYDRRIGRMILKFVGDDYLDKKESGKISDFTDQ